MRKKIIEGGGVFEQLYWTGEKKDIYRPTLPESRMEINTDAKEEDIIITTEEKPNKKSKKQKKILTFETQK